jgi:hypothetical protein
MLENLKKLDLKFILLLAIAALVLLNLKQCNDKSNLNSERQIYLNNLEALKDTVRAEKNKEGQLEFTKAALVAQNGELQHLNKDLQKEVEKEKGQILYLSKSAGGIKTLEPRIINSTVIVHDGGKYTIDAGYDTTYSLDNYRRVKFTSDFSVDSTGLNGLRTTLVKDELGFNIITGLKEEDGKLRIFIRSDYPNMTFTKIDGSLIDPKKSEVLKSIFKPKKFGVGPFIGIGVGSASLKPALLIGVGLQYNFIRF